MSWRKFYFLGLWLLFIVFLGPFVYLTRYAVLQLDDYCRASIKLTDFYSFISSWYLHHNGRYFNAILSSLPIYKTEIYRFILAILFLLFFYSMYVFLRSLFRYFKIYEHENKYLFLTWLSLVAILALIPNMNEFFYWYAGASVYEFSSIAFVFFLILLLKFWFKNQLDFYALCVITVIINGNSEMLVGITNFLLLCILFFKFKRTREINFKLIIVNVVSWISTIFLVFAPGMTVRRDQFSYGGDFFGSLKVAVIYGAKFLAVSMFDLTLIIFYIFLFLFTWKLTSKKKEKLPEIYPLLLFIISYLSIISMVFILYYAIGTFNSEGGWRTSNLLRVISFLFFVINIVNLACYLKNRGILLRIPSYVYTIIIVGMILSLYWNKNYNSLAEDLFSGSYEKFSESFAQREELIKSTNDSLLFLKPIKSNYFLKSGDYSLKKDNWVEDCYLNYIDLKYHKDFKNIEFIND